MKSYDWVETHLEARRLHDAAVSDMLVGAWSKFMRGMAALGKLARAASMRRHDVPHGRAA